MFAGGWNEKYLFWMFKEGLGRCIWFRELLLKLSLWGFEGGYLGVEIIYER